MAIQTGPLTGVERFFDPDEIIVSKTDTKGIITYANEVFQKVAQYSEQELLGKPHNIVRHPDMPRCVFKLLWDTIEAGNEIFAYVINRAKTGDHYWVFAHVTPSYDTQGNIVGYHSSRRVPDRKIVEGVIIPLYRTLLEEENKHANPKDAMAASLALFGKVLEDKGVGYDELIFSL